MTLLSRAITAKMSLFLENKPFIQKNIAAPVHLYKNKICYTLREGNSLAIDKYVTNDFYKVLQF